MCGAGGARAPGPGATPVLSPPRAPRGCPGREPGPAARAAPAVAGGPGWAGLGRGGAAGKGHKGRSRAAAGLAQLLGVSGGAEVSAGAGALLTSPGLGEAGGLSWEQTLWSEPWVSLFQAVKGGFPLRAAAP